MGNLVHPAPAEFTSAQIMDDPILRYFHYAHLPVALQASSKPFCDLAGTIVSTIPRNPERTVALRKLLEAKDAAVRANVPPAPQPETRTTARQSDEPDTEIGEGVRMIGADRTEDGPAPFFEGSGMDARGD